MMDWQPIETAPKDGIMIMLYKPKRKSHDKALIALGRWKSKPRIGYAWVINNGVSAWLPDEPTHWMTLPEVPRRKC